MIAEGIVAAGIIAQVDQQAARVVFAEIREGPVDEGLERGRVPWCGCVGAVVVERSRTQVGHAIAEHARLAGIPVQFEARRARSDGGGVVGPAARGEGCFDPSPVGLAHRDGEGGAFAVRQPHQQR